ncbi:hypothetical protein B5E80_17905 [Flavonifractor sp. An135]|nr:hypothetical protein [Flavonifractor sp. An135]OUQ18603.1 hypothetical protein B5E80_17905 [Flavonifractor sp. An135]
MSVDIGPKIGIDGEAEFRKQLGNINQQLKTLGSEMKAVTSAFEAGDRSEEALGARTEVLNRQIGAQEAKLEQLRKGLSAAAEKYGENDTKTLRWAQAVNDATADLNKLRAQLAQTEGELDDVADATGEVTDAMDDASDASGGLGDAIKGAILGGGIVETIRGAAGAVGDLVESTTEYRRIMGSLDVSSERAGYNALETAESYKQLYGVLADDQTTATTVANLQALGASQEKLRTIINGTIGAWSTYGDSIPIDGLAEALNETVRSGTVTGTFADVLNWGSQEGERFGVALKANTEANKEWNDAVKSAATAEDFFNLALQDAGSEAERLNLVMGVLSSQGLTQAGEQWQQANADLVAGNQAMADITAATAEFAEILSPAVTRAKQSFAGLLESALTVVEAFREGGFEQAFAWTGELLGQLAEDLQAQIPQVLEGMGSVFSGLPGVLSAAQTQITAAAASLMRALGQGLSENLPELLDIGLSALSDLSGVFRDNVGLLVDAAIDMAKGLAQGLADGIPAIIENVPTIITNITGAINDNAPKVLAAGIDIVVTLAKGLIDAIPVIIENLPKIFAAIVSTITAFNWISLGGSITTALSNGIRGAISFVSDAASSIVSTVKSGVSALPGQLLQVGKNLVSGLLNGVKSMGDWLKSQIKEFCTGVLNGFLDFFGIHSPSTLMRDQVGVMLAEGVAVGLKKGMTSVRRTASQVGDAIVDEINAVNADLERMAKEDSQRQAQQELEAYEKSVKDKYAQLAKAEKEERQAILDEIAELEADWNEKQVQAARDAEREAAKARLKALEEFQQEYQDRLDELNQEYEDNLDDLLDQSASMAEKLAGYGELFTMADDVLTLGDLQSDIDQIRAYGDALAALEERGIPEGLMDEITDLDVDDALAYADELLSMTDETYQEYMDLWQQKQDEAAKVASRFYQDDLAALQKEYVDQIPQALSGLKDEMENLGVESGQALADGFSSMAGEIIRSFVGVVSGALSAVQDFSGINSPSTVWRDEVGLQMARGLGVGFSDGMSAVQRQMQQAVPTLDLSAMQDLTAGLVTGLRGLTTGGAAAAAAPITLKVYLDKREIAEEIFDPLGDVSRRRGEPLGSH